MSPEIHESLNNFNHSSVEVQVLSALHRCRRLSLSGRSLACKGMEICFQFIVEMWASSKCRCCTCRDSWTWRRRVLRTPLSLFADGQRVLQVIMSSIRCVDRAKLLRSSCVASHWWFVGLIGAKHSYTGITWTNHLPTLRVNFGL